MLSSIYMLFRRRQENTLYCFSPPVMIATFVIEITMALYVIWRRKMNSLSRLVVASLCFLALFQMAEYFVCGGVGLSAMHWSRIGFAAITMLPPLGLHTLYVLAKRRERQVVWLAYASAAFFIGYFLLYPQAFSGYECTGNYVIFQLGGLATWLYSAYYYVWLLLSIYLGLRWQSPVRNKPQGQAISGLVVGYLVFLVPTGVAATLHPTALHAIPSIMCGFAVLFAIILTLYVLPKGTRALTPKARR